MRISNSKYPGITYDMFTGEFYRQNIKGTHGLVKTGLWGTLDSYGYLVGMFRCKMIKLHRMAFNFMGKTILPGDQVDHKNGIRNDNRWNNLRLVTRRENQQNTKESRISPKLAGATRRNKKWHSQICIDKKKLNLGFYDTELDAHTAYMNYMDKHRIPYLKEIDFREE